MGLSDGTSVEPTELQPRLARASLLRLPLGAMNTSSTAADSLVSAVHYERLSQRGFIDGFVRRHHLPYLLDSGSDISIIHPDSQAVTCSLQTCSKVSHFCQ